MTVFFCVTLYLSCNNKTYEPCVTLVNILHNVATMGVGKGPWILKISAKKVNFLVSSGKNHTLPVWPPRHILEKSPSGPHLKKILPTPMVVPWKVYKMTHVLQFTDFWLRFSNVFIFQILVHSIFFCRCVNWWHTALLRLWRPNKINSNFAISKNRVHQNANKDMRAQAP